MEDCVRSLFVTGASSPVQFFYGRFHSHIGFGSWAIRSIFISGPLTACVLEQFHIFESFGPSRLRKIYSCELPAMLPALGLNTILRFVFTCRWLLSMSQVGGARCCDLNRVADAREKGGALFTKVVLFLGSFPGTQTDPPKLFHQP